MSKTIVTYDNHIYEQLELEEVTQDSGRYKVVSRKPLTVYGTLDDEASYNKAEDLLNTYTFGGGSNTMFLILEGAGITKIFSTIRVHGINYSNRFDAVLDQIKQIGFLTAEPYAINDVIYFEIETYDGSQDVLTLKSCVNDIAVIGG